MEKIIYMDEIDAQTNHTMWMKLLMDEADKEKVARTLSKKVNSADNLHYEMF
jgi:hypothetical protein